MTPHQKIISRFPSYQALADIMSLIMDKRVPKTTVQGWHDSGFIPAKYHDYILEAGKSMAPPLITCDFFQSPDGPDQAS